MFGRHRKGAAGYVVISDPAKPLPIEGETRQCSHCGKHWIYRPGSGTERGYCMRCNGLTCGSEACATCVPYEAQIEIMEGAKTPMSRAYLEDYLKITKGR